MKNNSVYFRHIIEAIDVIESYIKGMDFEQFRGDKKTFDAVSRELMIIGEAVSKIGKDFTRQYPDIHWSGIVGMRNVIVHEYFGLNEWLIWKTVTGELAPLYTLLTGLPEEK